MRLNFLLHFFGIILRDKIIFEADISANPQPVLGKEDIDINLSEDHIAMRFTKKVFLASPSEGWP